MPPFMLAYRFFAREYGWTPDQVDEVDAEHIDWLMLIEEAAAEAQRIASKPKPDPGKGW
jgi:hypothetical protein